MHDAHAHSGVDDEVTTVINGTRPEDWAVVERLCRERKRWFPAYGVHPWHADELSEGWEACLRDHLGRGAVGIGETGLDRSRRGGDFDRQKQLFTCQWRLAEELGLPMFVHCVRAFGPLIGLIESLPPLRRGFLLHDYSGSVEMVERFQRLGAWFSFGPAIVDKTRRRAREAVVAVDAGRLLLETDSTICQPRCRQDLEGVYHEAARLRGCSLAAMSSMMTANFQRFLPLTAQQGS